MAKEIGNVLKNIFNSFLYNSENLKAFANSDTTILEYFFNVFQSILNEILQNYIYTEMNYTEEINMYFYKEIFTVKMWRENGKMHRKGEW